MTDRNNVQTPRPEELPPTEEYAPRQYPLRHSVTTTIKVMLLGGGALGALWLLDTLVTQ